LLYISRSALAPSEEAQGLADILTVSRARNADLDLTGCLIWTGSSFAQMIEGPSDAVEAVMQSIIRDPRHRDVRILFTQPIDQRRFADWRMAYSGMATYVDRHLALLFSGFAAQSAAIDQLVTLMEEYCRMMQRRH
jgi:hypothetical protein